MPDFSEFKDPWEEYSPQNDPLPTDNSALSDKNENCYCGIKYEKEADAVRQSDHSASQLAHNQQFHYEQQHSTYTPIQTYDQHAISHSEENRNQEHFVQHTEHHHWQQHNEQRHHHVHIEQHQHNEQWTEQRHHHVQPQHHEQRHHNEQQHYSEQRQHSEHHQQFHQHDYHRNKADDHHQHQQSVEVRNENHAQHYASGNSQTSHQNADHLSYIASHNESHVQHTNNQDARDNFASHCYHYNEKNNEQASEAVSKQTDTRRIDFLPSSPAPCTDLHNVATRSDPNVTEHLDNANVSNCSHILFFLNSSRIYYHCTLSYIFLRIYLLHFAKEESIMIIILL